MSTICGVGQCSREHDEIILEWLSWRQKGYSIRQIGTAYRVAPGSVQRATAAALKECDKHEIREAAE